MGDSETTIGKVDIVLDKKRTIQSGIIGVGDGYAWIA